MYIFCIHLCIKVVQDVCQFNLTCRYKQKEVYVGHGNLQRRWELGKNVCPRRGVIRIENKDTEIMSWLPSYLLQSKG
jgi:hypothetical protein